MALPSQTDASAAPSSPPELSSHAPLGPSAFVLLCAALMAMNALAIDIMLPGLPQIAHHLGVDAPNERQLVITAYLMGFGFGQFFAGPLSDRFGRRAVLLTGLFMYGIGAVLCAMAPDFDLLLAARAAQGLGAAAPRVIVAALVRDCYSGRQMARVTSLAMMTFMAAPVIAPSLGQAILFAGPWRLIFAVLAAYAGAVLLFAGLRLPETLPLARRRSLRPAVIMAGVAQVLTSRQTMGYAVASGVFFGALFGFIGSAEQILAELYALGPWFPVAFASVALSMALSAFLNAHLVERLGMRLLSHAAVLAFTAVSGLLAALALAGQPPVWLFLGLIGAAMMLVGMVFSNFNALAMEPQAAVAGLASSIIGGLTTLIGASLGYVIGNAYDGTVLPLALGYLFSGGGAVLVILMTEGRLFGTGRTAAAARQAPAE